MREKELRLALVCYGGISLAIYMHGVTKEIWRLARASRAYHDGKAEPSGVEGAYAALLALVEAEDGARLRVLPDIIAGASAGGINGIFLAQALSTGQSLDPLTEMWLENADTDKLIDPDARPLSAFSKFWAVPIAWIVTGMRGSVVRKTVAKEAREEVRSKLSRFVRARWFAPPFGGEVFTNMLLDAFDAMANGPVTERLIPDDQPLDLFVTVTDFAGYAQHLKLHNPAEIIETEHRLTLSFTDKDGRGKRLGAGCELAFAARATASFPGAFPPFNVAELDRVLADRQVAWPGRAEFLARSLPGHGDKAERAILIDGSVLANAPFQPALAALRDRPARREVDRRFVYIDPKPGIKSVSLMKNSGKAELPGFLSTIFGALSDIPREQPIRDSLEAIEGRSARIRRMQRIVEALRPDVNAAIEGMFGRTFFLDKPTTARLKAWRSKAQDRAARDANFAFAAYGHIKLSAIVEELAGLAARQDAEMRDSAFEQFRQSIWAEIRARKIDHVAKEAGKGASAAAITFFRAHDLGFRIRRLRFVIRTVSGLLDISESDEGALVVLQAILFKLLSHYLERESVSFYKTLDQSSAAAFMADVEQQRDLTAQDIVTDNLLAEAFALCPKAERRVVLFAYLGFPFYDISTLPMLQGEGLDEFDPIKVDRISPDDATAIRSGVNATLKGIQFNSFGAFFSRSYRENDYLWGRLHGAERLFDIIASTVNFDVKFTNPIKRALLLAILDEEQPRLTKIPELFDTLRREIAAGPLAA